MAVRSKNVHWKLADIKRRHWEHLGRTSGLSDGAWIDQIVDKTPSVIETVRGLIPAGSPEAVADTIFAGMRQQVRQLVAHKGA